MSSGTEGLFKRQKELIIHGCCSPGPGGEEGGDLGRRRLQDNTHIWFIDQWANTI